MTKRAGPSWLYLSSSEDEEETETYKKEKYSSMGSEPIKTVTKNTGNRRAAWAEEEIIEPCKSPQCSDEMEGESDHVEDYDDCDEADLLSTISSTHSEAKRKVDDKSTSVHDVNHERTMFLKRKTIIYGQTPLAIRRSQLTDMALSSGMSVEDFAKYILRSNTMEKLQCLQLYHTSRLHELSPLFNDLQRCEEKIVNEEDTSSYCPSLPVGQSNKKKRQSKMEIQSAKVLGQTQAQRIRRRKKYSLPVDSSKDQLTVIPDTESDQSDVDYIPPSPDSRNSHIHLKRTPDAMTIDKTKDKNNLHVDVDYGPFLSRNSSSASTTSSLFEPLIRKENDDSDISEPVEKYKSSDYNPILDKLFGDTPSDAMASSSTKARSSTLLQSQEIPQNRSTNFHENKDYNNVLDNILFGEPLDSSTQEQNSLSTSGRENVCSRSREKMPLIKQRLPEIEREDNDKSTFPSSFELARSPWSTLEHLFDD